MGEVKGNEQVEDFGSKLQMVSLTAPGDIVARSIQEIQ
jgi:hypothetical protein